MTVLSADINRAAGMQNLRDLSKFMTNVIVDPETRSATMRGVRYATSLLSEVSVAMVIDGSCYGPIILRYLGSSRPARNI
jgi:hypothetical protein